MRTFALAALAFGATACIGPQPSSPPATPLTTVVLASEVPWEPLNPARGDRSPQAGTLWGDRGSSVATGFLLRPADGFESPPHLHNVSYRGIVIRGLLHNDDPDAATTWMPAGSFWTQPAGEVHITAARGNDALAYIEIEDGPYLVQPVEEAFDNGERAINVDRSNLVWLDAASTTWIATAESHPATGGPRVAFLWGDPRAGSWSGSLVRLPAGCVAEIRGLGASLRAVVIEGRPSLGLSGAPNASGTSGTSGTSGALGALGALALDPGSSIHANGPAVHRVTSEADAECLLYVRAEGRFEVRAVPAPR